MFKDPTRRLETVFSFKLVGENMKYFVKFKVKKVETKSYKASINICTQIQSNYIKYNLSKHYS